MNKSSAFTSLTGGINRSLLALASFSQATGQEVRKLHSMFILACLFHSKDFLHSRYAYQINKLNNQNMFYSMIFFLALDKLFSSTGYSTVKIGIVGKFTK